MEDVRFGQYKVRVIDLRVNNLSTKEEGTMGIFGKDKNTDDLVFEAPNNAANEINLEMGTTSTDETLEGSHRQNLQSAEYGIQDAIELMRQLPNVNTDIVISVVIKTLESANIQVSEIICDAGERETRIENRSVELISKIEQLDIQITELNEEITHLNADFEETTKVKSLLEASLKQDKPKKEKEPKVSESVVESVGTESDATENKKASTQDAAKTMITADNLSLVDGNS
ncbi:MAG: hypothetical protein GXP19_07020 [Gammaproteobacteria bacterium]|nr:hypothetical protein [Gammaproteobacteria bacterium]